MLTIIIGIILVVVLIIIAVHIGNDGFRHMICAVATICLLSSIVIGIFCPTKYGEWELINQTELVTLSNSTVIEGGGAIYVSVSGENVYSYRYEIESPFGTKTSKEYEVGTISGSIIESEDENCEVPVLLEYNRKGKVTIWSFGVISDKKYVFYVPKGTIQKEISLK